MGRWLLSWGAAVHGARPLVHLAQPLEPFTICGDMLGNGAKVPYTLSSPDTV